MKKEIIISLVIVVVIIILDIITQRYTNCAMTEVSDMLDSVREELVQANEEEANQKMEMAKAKWDEVKEKLVIYIEHAELEKVDVYIVESNSCIKTKEFMTAIEAIDKCNFAMGYIRDKYELSIKNIF